MLDHIRPAIATLALMTLLTGVAYPLAVTGVAQVAFPDQASGSLVRDAAGQVRGSRLIAQAFDGDQWFQPRPSAGNYATVASAASNLAPSNPKLRERIEQASAHLSGQAPVPMQLVTTSGSGLDPHLSPEAAAWQIPRIAQARGLAQVELLRLVEAHTERPLFGPAVVNVLALNLALVDNPVLSAQ
ncbi:potassium-transporting ATPase subunit KdpC [Ectopseudomonas mendocina]|uniref:Potassium-transporting ATPase KdpC subunit n=1 Tax=Ectopseudomonas mendocina TaxID=300 RepID=A0A379INZ5_ECTME|nr:potassium-transporting ATPase subunit KdpC [Pseudomonas mendocina]AEB60671.1 potassium-transporting ATPase subunit C [Pseudomonas mendocina NK-01]SUD38017.1 potassium-transporting ATPase subunit C [Pseudomonas mendocina]